MPSSSSRSVHSAQRALVLGRARQEFFARGYSRLKMADLAADLGLSKKTLYVHFRGKDALIAAVIDGLAVEIRRHAQALLRDERLAFPDKLHAFASGMAQRLERLDRHTLLDLERHAPALLARIEKVRAKTIPIVFGQFIEAGKKSGHIRSDLNSRLAIEFFLHAMQGLLQPASLERIRLAPHQVIPAGIGLFFGGLMTSKGKGGALECGWSCVGQK